MDARTPPDVHPLNPQIRKTQLFHPSESELNSTSKMTSSSKAKLPKETTIKPKNQRQASSEKYPNSKGNGTRQSCLIEEFTTPNRKKAIDTKIKIILCPRNRVR